MDYDASMPKALVRYQQTRDPHFVTFSCYQRRPYLGSAKTRDIFLKTLETMRQRYGFWLSGYVVMPEHVHLLISEPEKAALSKALQAIKLSVAVQRKERPFWQARYYDFNVYTKRKHEEKLSYMHRNPVVRELVAEPDEWRWSSFRHHWIGEISAVEIESRWTASLRDCVAMKAHVSEARHGAPASVIAKSDVDHV
jgi:putative transposase